MILAVDVAIATCGWAVIPSRSQSIREGHVVDLGVIATAPEDGIAKTVSNARRIASISERLESLCDAYGITTIAGEQMLSFGSVHAVVPQALCWGVLASIAAHRGIELVEVVAKHWQDAVAPGVSKLKKAKRYPIIEAEVSRFIGPRLVGIEPSLRTHAVDATAIGLFARYRRTQCRTVLKATTALPVEQEGAAA